jgi:hypothetical protein
MYHSTVKRVSLLGAAASCAGLALTPHTLADAGRSAERAALSEGSIEHILVIDLENEDYKTTFGPSSPATYLNGSLLKQGQLIPNYFATSHVSLGNYLSQVSGQAPTPAQNNDCIDLASLRNPPVRGGFTNVTPGTAAADQSSYPGQVVGDGCVFPAGALTLGDQLDALERDDDDDRGKSRRGLRWRSYAEDMGNDRARDYGTPDPLGGASCAHPPVGGVDNSNSAAANDQYATRHNPFVYFHSVIDDQARCEQHVVPLGKLVVGQNGKKDVFSGHLYEDLRSPETTPNFMFVSPNLCNDGHDATCVGPNVEGGTQGGLVAADLWLKHWMPMIFESPAYKSGKLLVVLTFDESGFGDARACPAANQADCHSPTGPNVTNPGYSPILGAFGLQTPPTTTFQYAGGGQVGSVNTTGVYDHYSALRSYEDLLGITHGGADGQGHLGYAASPNKKPFGRDVFSKRAERD